MYWITSLRRSCLKSTSMSGGSLRSAETKRSNSRSCRLGSTSVTPRQKHTDQCELMLEVLTHFVRDAPGIAHRSAFPCQVDERVLGGGKARAQLVGIFVA